MAIATPAYACRCAMPDAAQSQKHYDEADAVLKAMPIEFSNGWNASGPLITFEILEVHKGKANVGDEIVAKNNPLTAACGNHIEPETEYVLGFWDLQRDGYEVANAIGYRVMHSCAQMSIQKFIQDKQQTKDK